MKGSLVYLFLLLAFTSCAISTSVLCVSEEVNHILFVGKNQPGTVQGIWLIKYSSDTTIEPSESSWLLVLENPDFIGSNSKYVLAARKKPEKYLILETDGKKIKTFNVYHDSMKFVSGRIKMQVPDSIRLASVEYIANAPCLSDTISRK